MRFLLVVAAIAAAVPSHAQLVRTAAPPDPLFQTVAALDKEMFDAVNRCDLKKVDTFWADDAEFYHDKNGLIVGRKNIIESVRNNLCGKVVRELVQGTLEVYPVPKYGAVESGAHRFYHPGDQDHAVIGQSRFIHVWQLKDGAWKIKRVISYDHNAAR